MHCPRFLVLGLTCFQYNQPDIFSVYLGSYITINLPAFEISYHRSQHFGNGRTLEIFKRHLKSHFTYILEYFLHATFHKHKVPNMLSKVKLMLPTSVLSSLLGEVKSNMVLGEKDQLSLILFSKIQLWGHMWFRHGM